MNPYLDNERSPHIKVDIYLSSWINVDCFIDTGFAGGISLPIHYQNLFKSRKPVTYLEFKLADGSTRFNSVYKTKIRYKNKQKDIFLVFSGDDALIGIEFLLGFKFILDLKKFRVSLE